MSQGPTAKRAALPAFGAGVAAVSLGSVALFGAPGDAQPGAACVWVADRDGDRVVVLDRDLVAVRSFAVRAPIALASARAGGFWVLSVPSGGADAARRLDLVAHDGASTSVVALDARFGVVVEARTGLVVVGADDGRLRWIDVAATPRVVLEQVARAGVRDLARDESRPGDVWVLAADGSLARYDELGVLARAPCVAERATAIASADARAGAWLWSSASCRMLGFDAAGRATASRALDLDRAEVAAARPELDAGWLLATPGAVIAFDARGRVAAGQGGFDWIADVAVR